MALARLLAAYQCKTSVYLLESGKTGTADFQANLERLREYNTEIHHIQSPEFFPDINPDDIIVDAIIGTGLTKSLEGITAALVGHINSCNARVISIDLPAGMFADKSSRGNTIIIANHTLTFQNYKLAFLLPENEDYCGDVQVLDIGLDKSFEEKEEAEFEISGLDMIRDQYKPRKKFSHKGSFGHALVIAGSKGMMGAAVLCARACLRSGVGKITCLVPGCGYTIMQVAVPEAMCLVSGEEYLLPHSLTWQYNTIGIGPGIGLHLSHAGLLKMVFGTKIPHILIDADALNTLSGQKELKAMIPEGSILTPHPKEFENLFGAVVNDVERLRMALLKSKEFGIYIVLKGHYSFISTPGGKGYFNNTGNPGMATAGSGDVLSGIITGLLAQGYNPLQACLMGTWLHGTAGDLAAENLSQEAMTAGDIVEYLPGAFKQLSQVR